MKQRITISIDEKVIAQLRKMQAEIIQKESRSVSLSEIVELVVGKGIKK